MARVQGRQGKASLPLYDAFVVPDTRRRGTPTFEMARMSRIRRMICASSWTCRTRRKLETNLQASGHLPSQNTFEVRAMRVVVSHSPEGTTKDDSHDRTDNVLADLIYNSVTSSSSAKRS